MCLHKFQLSGLKVIPFIWALLIFVAAPTQAEPGNEGFSISSVKIQPRDVEKFSYELNKTGRVRVIVGIASPDEPDAILQRNHMSTPSKKLSRREAINRLQERVVEKLLSLVL